MMEDVVYRVGMQGGEIVLVPMRGIGTIRLRELIQEATKELIAEALSAAKETDATTVRRHGGKRPPTKGQ
jgi:hypothetical protein